MRTSRSFDPFAGPTSPRRSIVSTMRAARLYFGADLARLGELLDRHFVVLADLADALPNLEREVIRFVPSRHAGDRSKPCANGNSQGLRGRPCTPASSRGRSSLAALAAQGGEARTDARLLAVLRRLVERLPDELESALAAPSD